MLVRLTIGCVGHSRQRECRRAHIHPDCATWFAVDADALLAAIKEKLGNSVSEVTKPQLKDVFLGLGYDKETIEELPEEEEAGEGEGEEGEEAKPARPPPKKEVSQFAEQTFDLIAASRDPVQLPSTAQSADAIDLTYLLPTLQLCKSGYGEPSLRFALKVADVEGAGALKERPLWTALVRCTNTNLDSIARNHLRRAVSGLSRTWCRLMLYLPLGAATRLLPPLPAPVCTLQWRTAEKQPLEGEEGAPEEGADGSGEETPAASEGEGEGEGEDAADGEAAPAAPAAPKAPKPKPGPEDVKVLVDSFLEKVTEDERLSALLLREVPIPEPPKGADENLPPAEED